MIQTKTKNIKFLYFQYHGLKQLKPRAVASLETQIKNQLINIPWDLLAQSESENKKMNYSCGRLPNLLQLHLNNIYWQVCLLFYYYY